MKSTQTAADVGALLRARNPLLWVVSREEARAERYLMEAAAAANYATLLWDVAQGVTRLDGSKENISAQDPGDALDAIQERTQNGARTLWIMRDLPVWLQGPASATTLRKLRNLARSLPGVPRDHA